MRAAVFTAASQPSISWVASVSAMPKDCAFFNDFLEAETVFHFGENDVCCRIQDAVKSAQVNCGKLIEKRKDGNAVHYGGFEEEAFVFAMRRYRGVRGRRGRLVLCWR